MNFLKEFCDDNILVPKLKNIRVKEISKRDMMSTYKYIHLEEGKEITFMLDYQKYIKGIELDVYVERTREMAGKTSEEVLLNLYEKSEIKSLVQLIIVELVNFTKSCEERFLYATREKKVKFGEGIEILFTEEQLENFIQRQK